MAIKRNEGLPDRGKKERGGRDYWLIAEIWDCN